MGVLLALEITDPVRSCTRVWHTPYLFLLGEINDSSREQGKLLWLTTLGSKLVRYVNVLNTGVQRYCPLFARLMSLVVEGSQTPLRCALSGTDLIDSSLKYFL